MLKVFQTCKIYTIKICPYSFFHIKPVEFQAFHWAGLVFIIGKSVSVVVMMIFRGFMLGMLRRGIPAWMPCCSSAGQLMDFTDVNSMFGVAFLSWNSGESKLGCCRCWEYYHTKSKQSASFLLKGVALYFEAYVD